MSGVNSQLFQRPGAKKREGMDSAQQVTKLRTFGQTVNWENCRWGNDGYRIHMNSLKYWYNITIATDSKFQVERKKEVALTATVKHHLPAAVRSDSTQASL